MEKQAAERCSVKANTPGISCNFVLLLRNLERSFTLIHGGHLSAQNECLQLLSPEIQLFLKLSDQIIKSTKDVM